MISSCYIASGAILGLTPNFRAKWVGLYPSSRHEDAGDLS
jgi:hypothetical protein